MARGKHASSADARRKLAHLENEHAELERASASARDSYVAQMARLNDALAAGSAPEVARLQAELAEAEDIAAHATQEVGAAIAHVFRDRDDFVASQEFWAALAAALGVPVKDVMTLAISRYERRLTPKKVRRSADDRRQLKSYGYFG
jgi:hypothetical protein